MSPNVLLRRWHSSPSRDDLMKITKTNSKTSSSSSSPRDSLSPLDNQYQSVKEFISPGNDVQEDMPRGRTRQVTPVPVFAFTDYSVPAEGQTAGSPRSSLIVRSHRPIDLHIALSNGLTTVPSTDLKKAIGNGRTAPCITRTQVPLPGRDDSLLTPDSARTMGNRPSSIAGSPAPDNESLRNVVVRKPARVMRKSSANVFKRVEANVPLPRPVTATTILVMPDGSRSLDGESPIDPFLDPAHATRRSVIVSKHMQSESIATVKADHDEEPLSASTTIRDSRAASNGSYFHQAQNDADGEPKEPPAVPTHRMSALSPTLPAPSPLPEDSPHKYGLRDRMDTPELAQEQPSDDADVKNARRRSTGPEIFNEAKSLQSAASFLNGLSTSRRRAESTDRPAHWSEWSHVSGARASRPNSRPTSRPVSSRPPSVARPRDVDNDGRRRGHNFKTNGFAFARPMAVAQLKCFRQHDRLIVSRNKVAPVECAVCHMDDDREHWSCSWCALRMCGYCRRRFEDGGVDALRARVKDAEFGSEDSVGNESMESLGRGRSAYLE